MNYYRQAYPELNGFVDNLLREHMRRFAVEQGRSTCAYDRREYLQVFLQNTIDGNGLRALEISPWDNPFLRGANVKYFGVEDAESLRESAVKFNRPFKHVPEKIHFVSPAADLSVVDETFDIVFSSHVIEHCPDLVTHFNNVAKILNAGGLYVLIVPDKRYCFDYYHSDSTITEVIEAFAVRRKIPRLADVINLLTTSTHNNSVMHWFDIHGERYGLRNDSSEISGDIEIAGELFKIERQPNPQKLSHAIEKYSEALSKGEYISTHNWRFTPDSFGYIVDTLKKLQLINLSLFRLCHTLWGRQEFVVMLEKT